MTAPKRDNRPLIDKAREMKRRGLYFVHENSGDAYDVIVYLLDLEEKRRVVAGPP